MHEYPQLNEVYQQKVKPDGRQTAEKSENEFWEEFLKKNNKYTTEVFGGNNPIFLPFATDEIEYDEIYINGNVNQKFREERL